MPEHDNPAARPAGPSVHQAVADALQTHTATLRDIVAEAVAEGVKKGLTDEPTLRIMTGSMAQHGTEMLQKSIGRAALFGLAKIAGVLLVVLAVVGVFGFGPAAKLLAAGVIK